MKKRILVLFVLIVALALSAVLVACKGNDSTKVDSVTIVTSTGTVLCVIDKDGGVSTDNITYEYNGGNVYSWVAVSNGEKVRVISNEQLERNDKEEYVATLLGESKVIVYPEKYYTLLTIADSTITQKAVIGEIPRALPVSQRGYSEFLGYYYLNSKDEKVALTNENGNFSVPWSINVKSITLYADFNMEPIGVKLNYGVKDPQNSDERDVPSYVYYGDTLRFAFPLPTHSGYDFQGWYTEETAGVQIVDEKGRYNLDQFKSDTAKNVRYTINETEEGTFDYEVVFFARWKAKSFSVKYYNGADVVKELAVNYGESVPNLEAPSQSGQTFMYWYADDEDVAYDFSEKMSYYNLDLHCKWVDSRSYCPNCGQVIDDSSAPTCKPFYCPNESCGILLRGAVADHNYGELTEITPATCYVEGVARKQCLRCGDSEDVVIPVLEHNYVFKEMLPATCSSVGYTAYECVYCKTVDVRYDDVIVDHKFNTSRVPATQFELGYTSNKCIVCGAFENNYFDIEGRSFIAISNKETLFAAAKDTVSNYALMTDLSLGGDEWFPWGVDEDGVYTPYQGIFNGNGHIISDYKITTKAYKENAYRGEDVAIGFFAAIDGEVTNLYLNGNVNCSPVYCDEIYIGGLAGKIGKQAKITSVFVNGDLKLNDNTVSLGGNVKAGGLVGLSEGKIEACYANVSRASALREGLAICAYNYASVGGLVGEMTEDAKTFTSSAYGVVSVTSKVADAKVGGVVGVNKGILVDTIAYGSVNGVAALQSMVGGVVGVNENVAYKSLGYVDTGARGADEKQSFVSHTIAIDKGTTYNVYGLYDNSALKYDHYLDITNDPHFIRANELAANAYTIFGRDFDLFDATSYNMTSTYTPFAPNSFLQYFSVKNTPYVIDVSYANASISNLESFNMTELLKGLEGGVRYYQLSGSYDLEYGSTYLIPLCKTVEGVKYFFGTFDGQGNTIKKFKFASGTTSLFKNNYGTVKNINLKFFYHEDKEIGESYKTGIVDNNYGTVENATQDGNYRIRLKRGMQIFLGIFVTLIVLCIFFGLESGAFSEYSYYGMPYVSAILSLLIVGGAVALGIFLGSTRLAVYMAITTSALSIWPLSHSAYVVADGEFWALPVVIIHGLTLLGGVAFAVVALMGLL